MPRPSLMLPRLLINTRISWGARWTYAASLRRMVHPEDSLCELTGARPAAIEAHQKLLRKAKLLADDGSPLDGRGSAPDYEELSKDALYLRLDLARLPVIWLSPREKATFALIHRLEQPGGDVPAAVPTGFAFTSAATMASLLRISPAAYLMDRLRLQNLGLVEVIERGLLPGYLREGNARNFTSLVRTLDPVSITFTDRPSAALVSRAASGLPLTQSPNRHQKTIRSLAKQRRKEKARTTKKWDVVAGGTWGGPSAQRRPGIAPKIPRVRTLAPGTVYVLTPEAVAPEWAKDPLHDAFEDAPDALGLAQLWYDLVETYKQRNPERPVANPPPDRWSFYQGRGLRRLIGTLGLVKAEHVIRWIVPRWAEVRTNFMVAADWKVPDTKILGGSPKRMLRLAQLTGAIM
jgi:hypothetical protein